MKYAIHVASLSEEDGGGFMASVPDLYGCQSDGETPEEAVQNVQLAIDDWIECQKEAGREIPKPGTAAKRSMDDRKRLVNAIKALSEGYEGFNRPNMGHYP